jgi:hypothetical protein
LTTAESKLLGRETGFLVHGLQKLHRSTYNTKTFDRVEIQSRDLLSDLA